MPTDAKKSRGAARAGKSGRAVSSAVRHDVAKSTRVGVIGKRVPAANLPWATIEELEAAGQLRLLP